MNIIATLLPLLATDERVDLIIYEKIKGHLTGCTNDKTPFSLDVGDSQGKIHASNSLMNLILTNQKLGKVELDKDGFVTYERKYYWKIKRVNDKPMITGWNRFEKRWATNNTEIDTTTLLLLAVKRLKPEYAKRLNILDQQYSQQHSDRKEISLPLKSQNSPF